MKPTREQQVAASAIAVCRDEIEKLRIMETHFRELDAQGYTLLEDLLTPEQIARAIAALDAT